MFVLLPRLLVTDSELQIVDVGIIESSIFPTIDIKLRNTGEKVAFIKTATIKVERIWELYPGMRALAAIESSHDYPVTLKVTGAPYSVTKGLSQSIESNGVDRFTLSFHNDHEKDFTRDYVFQVRIELIYNEGNRSVTTQNLLFVTESEGMYQCNFENAEERRICDQHAAHNRRVVSEINQITGLKSETLKDFLGRVGGPRIWLPPNKPLATSREVFWALFRPAPADEPSFTSLSMPQRAGEGFARQVRLRTNRTARASQTSESVAAPQHVTCLGQILAASGLVLTVAHCVERADEAEVTLCDERKLKVEAIVTDPKKDIAFMKITLKPGDVDRLLKCGRLRERQGQPSRLVNRDGFYLLRGSNPPWE